ncbi:ABC transporter permease [Clostridioides mangenotii]|uniref:ABC transporter permease n=1 Tax=Metaclostridioides mangenotii TaxID=1540 RepID=UPI002149A703|nr:ABC transporter permease [Clostridioides mangenotii]MCR1954139.1 ABC transporter permease [Clostridioides mangenotii]
MLERLKDNLKGNKLAMIAFIVIIVFCLASILAFLSPFDPNKINITERLLSPNKTNIFGTDNMGRDYFTRTLYGGRVSLTVGFLSMLISTSVGTFVGAISGYFGGVIDAFITRVLDILMSIPTFFLILVINSFFGSSIKNIIIVIGLLGWMSVARVVRSETLSIKEREYVLYAKSLGQRPLKIITKHIIPSILPTVIVTASINIANSVLMESSLSFLGLGVQQPNSSWGSMLKDAQGFLTDAPHMAMFPGLFILLTVLSFNLMGDTLRSVFEAKSNER